MIMKTIIRRLRRLEEDRSSPERQEREGLAELLRERRRRRAEASGEPFEEWPGEKDRDDHDAPLSVAGILRSRFRRAAQERENACQCR